MKIAVELLKQGLNSELSSSQVKMLIHEYLFHRKSAKLAGEARLKVVSLETKLKKILSSLATIDQFTSYPMRIGEGEVVKTGKSAKIEYVVVKSRDEHYKHLIERIEDEK